MLGQAVQGVVDTGKVAETKAMDMVNGRGDMVDVVTAISQTELAMETMVAGPRPGDLGLRGNHAACRSDGARRNVLDRTLMHARPPSGAG